MNKKIISFILLASAISTIFINTPAFASTNNKSNISKIQTQKSANQTIVSIKEIQNKYLIQNKDGTLRIKETAKNNIDKKILEEINKNLEFTNSQIKRGNLKFELKKENGNVKVINTKANTKKILSSEFNKSNSVDNIFTYKYCSNFDWFWYGFDCSVNYRGTKLLKDEFVRIGEIFGWGSLALTAMGGPLGLASGLFTLMTIGDTIYQCNLAIDSGGGVYVNCFGSPSNAAVARATA